MKRLRRLDEPTMSDKTLLVSVEDLINRALGPDNCNVVHFKLIQAVLHILARQMRLLEQLVEIKMSDLEEQQETYQEQSSIRSSPTKGSPSRKAKDKGDKTKSPPRKGDKHAKDENKISIEDKDGEKADQTTSKEKEKGEKYKTREGKAATREGERAERAFRKERPKRLDSGTSIAISEVERQKEKVLVVGKGPSTTTRHERRDSIEVVTRSQFDLVETIVRQIQELSGPLPLPALPTNRKLRSDIAMGNASLPDTMEAMQLAARVNAAERAISQMADLLTQLAAAGALPREVADMVSELESHEVAQGEMKRRPSTVSHKSVAMHPSVLEEQSDMRISKAPSRYSVAASRASIRSSMVPGSIAEMPGVTHPEMDVAMQALRDELMKQAQMMTTKANAVADNANHTARDVSEKMNIAIELNNRITTLNGQVVDYAEQLSGFDTGLSSQMSSFRDQMTQIRGELRAGLAQLELVNNNAETAAVMDLTERYEQLVLEMGRTMHTHTGLTIFQEQLADELKSLVECLEMLREQKADRDEVLDGLRDKADNSRLAGLLTTAEFELARAELEGRLALCYDKFHKQETVWMAALKDLSKATEQKAEITKLMAIREDVEEKLRELQDMQKQLAIALGEPKAAIIMRALSKDAYCASCLAGALMEPSDPGYGLPPPLPPARPYSPPADSETPCAPTWRPPPLSDYREHACNRWAGGSHTLLAPVVRARAPAPAGISAPPVHRYTGYGSDGRLYMMEEGMQPCQECNQQRENEKDEPTMQGAGDQATANRGDRDGEIIKLAIGQP